MKKKKIHPDFNDILITPAKVSSIRSRTQVNPFHNLGSKEWSPIIVSPMDTVIDKKNWWKFINIGRMPICFPRGIKYTDFDQAIQYQFNLLKEGIFFSYSLQEIEKLVFTLISDDEYKATKPYINHNILIDIANGHISSLVKCVKDLKSYLPNVKIMVGNIANPDTYKVYSEAGADYVRAGIGFGGGCLTAMNTGVGYSMASLIYECNEIKEELLANNKHAAKIVADGGFKEYSDVIKALYLGADHVMLGSILNKALESAGDTYWKGIKVPYFLIDFMWKNKFKLEKKFRGMSTKEVQKAWGKKELKTSEGVVRMRTVKYTLQGWVENFQDYLKSAMSYTDSKTLDEFIGNDDWTVISENSFNRFKK
jgi:GMP reductase